jgi:hypothetical protein
MQTSEPNLLAWKKMTLPDQSGYWYEAYIPHLKWTYIIDPTSQYNSPTLNSPTLRPLNFNCTLFINNHTNETALHKYPVKNLKNAKAACKNHLLNTYKHLNNLLQKPAKPACNKPATCLKKKTSKKS